jgi:hypothetical protein
MEPALARPEPRRFRRGRRLQGGAHKTPFQLPGAHGLRFAKQWAPMFSAFFRPRTGQGRLAPCAKRPVDEDTCWFGPRPGAWARLSFEPARYPFFVCRLRSRTPRTPVVVSFGGIRSCCWCRGDRALAAAQYRGRARGSRHAAGSSLPWSSRALRRLEHAGNMTLSTRTIARSWRAQATMERAFRGRACLENEQRHRNGDEVSTAEALQLPERSLHLSLLIKR